MITHIILNRIVQKAIQNNTELASAFFAIHVGYDDEIDPLHRESYVEQCRDEEIRKLDRAFLAVERAHEYKTKHNSQSDFACVTGTHEV